MTRLQFWLATAIACMAIVLVIVNGVLFTGNRALQADINNRAQFVQQSIQLEGLYNDIVRSLAELSARTNDEKLKSLLGRVGISFTLNPPAPATPAPKR